MEGDPEGRLPEAPVWFSYVENESLAEKFWSKSAEFKNSGDREFGKPVLLFHGTSFDNTDGICRDIIQWEKHAYLIELRPLQISFHGKLSAGFWLKGLSSSLLLAEWRLQTKKGSFTAM